MTLFLIDAILKTTVLLAAAGVVSSLLRRSSAASRHLIWTIALIAALAMPLLSIALPRWQVPMITVAPSVSTTTPLIEDTAARQMATRLFEKLRTPVTSSAVTVSDKMSNRTPRTTVPWTVVALGAWAAGTILILGRLLLGLIAVQVLSRRTERVHAASWLPLARQLARALGISRVTFRRSRHAAMPMAWGVWHASVTMPADADDWSEDRLRIVLLHELAHVKRRDCLTHILAQVACALYWFNPLAWVAARHVRAERERACDDLVLAAGTPGADYADQLIEIARVMRAGRFSSVVAGASLAMAQRSQLEGRLMAILDPSVPRTGVSRVGSIVAAVVAAVTLVPLASLQAWGIDQSTAPKPTPIPTVVTQPTPSPDPAVIVRSQLRGEVRGPVRGVVTGVTQGVVHGAIQSSVEGTMQGVVSGGIHGGVPGGVRGGVMTDFQATKPKVTRETAPEVVDAPQESKSKADPKVVAALTAALKDTDKDVRETALHALVKLRDPGVFEPLLQALKDGSPDMREQAAFGLGQMRDKRAVEPLLGAMKDTSDNVREQVVFALGQIRDPRATEALISALKDTHANVREQAAFALGQLRASSAVEALVVALKDANASVREQAAFALGQIRDPRAIDGLTTALKDASANVRQQAAFALGQLAR